MATVVETEAKLDTSNFEEGIEKMKEGMEEAADKAGETSEETKKDWGAIGGLFQDFLPRGLQRTIRSFQMTQRSVGRAARSFKVLKGAIISTGIGALIVLLGELIENWQDVSDWLGITSEAQREYEEAVEKTNVAVGFQNAVLQEQAAILADANVPLEQREAVLANLQRTVQGLTDLDLQHADAQERISNAIERQNRLLETESMLKQTKIQIEEKLQTLAEDMSSWTDIGKSKSGQAAAQAQRAAEYEQSTILPLRERMNQLLADQAELIAEITAEQEEQAAEAERLRKAEQEEAAAEAKRQRDIETARKDRIRQQQTDNKAILDSEKTLAQARMTDFEVQEDNLRRAEEDALASVKSTEARIAVEEKYAELRRQMYEEENDRLDAIANQETETEQAALQQQLADQQALADEFFEAEQGEFEKREVEAMRQFEQKMERAEGNNALEEQVQLEFNQTMAAITSDRNQAVLDADQKAKDARQRALEEEIADSNRLFGARASSYKAMTSAVTDFSAIAAESGEQSKELAVVQIAVDQALAIASAIRGASQAAAAGGPAAPFIIGGYIASMIAAITSGFSQVGSLMASADESVARIDSPGGGRAPQEINLTPTTGVNPFGPAATAPTLNSRAYLVQSDLQGAQLEYERTQSFATL